MLRGVLQRSVLQNILGQIATLCNAGTLCTNNACVPCGGPGQTCCANSACAAGNACNKNNLCALCGGAGQICCAGNTCTNNGCCDNTQICVTPTAPSAPAATSAPRRARQLRRHRQARAAAAPSCNVGCCIANACVATGTACTAGTFCDGANVCAVCGTLDDVCCATGNCQPGQGLCDINQNKCDAIGGPGQPCAAGNTCDDGAAAASTTSGSLRRSDRSAGNDHGLQRRHLRRLRRHQPILLRDRYLRSTGAAAAEQDLRRQRRVLWQRLSRRHRQGCGACKAAVTHGFGRSDACGGAQRQLLSDPRPLPELLRRRRHSPASAPWHEPRQPDDTCGGNGESCCDGNEMQRRRLLQRRKMLGTGVACGDGSIAKTGSCGDGQCGGLGQGLLHPRQQHRLHRPRRPLHQRFLRSRPRQRRTLLRGLGLHLPLYCKPPYVVTGVNRMLQGTCVCM